MSSANGKTPVSPNLSEAPIMNEKLPHVVGVPESSPAVENVSPGGSEPPSSENVYGAFPPDAARNLSYGMPYVPLPSDPPRVSGTSVTSRTYARLIVAAVASFTVTPNANTPPRDGVPVSAPFADSTRPGGSEVPFASEKAYGGEPPTPVSCAVYAAPAVASCSVDGSTFSV